MAILVMMSAYLEKFGLIDWFSHLISTAVSGWHWLYAFLSLTLVYFTAITSLQQHCTRQLYVCSFPCCCYWGRNPSLLAALVLGFMSSLFSSMTHYGTSAAAVSLWYRLCSNFNGGGVGFIISIVNLIIWLVGGGLWWKILGIW